jgi:hypothetical protein
MTEDPPSMAGRQHQVLTRQITDYFNNMGNGAVPFLPSPIWKALPPEEPRNNGFSWLNQGLTSALSPASR